MTWVPTFLQVRTEIKDNVLHVQAMQVYKGSIDKTPFILHLRTTRECHIQDRAALLPGKEHWTALNMVLGGAQTVWWGREECLGLPEIERRTV
jgi:hypothetical protein